jgi:NADH:ubiquinone oxidoreductase subunit 5 (subunit L)/multisubunit Na+/H+ antiporter MnhA subunit
VTVLAFAVGGVALMGVLPSGAYLAKKLLLGAADASGQWWWEVVLEAGGFFTAGYVVLVLAFALGRPATAIEPRVAAPRLQEWAALALAVCSLLLALTASLGPVPRELLANPLSLKELGSTLLLVAGGAALALGLARRLPALPASQALRAAAGPARRAMLAVGEAFELTDGGLRRWAVAGISLLVVALALGGAMAASR